MLRFLLPAFVLMLAVPANAQADIALATDFNGTGGFNRACLNDGSGGFPACTFVPTNTDRRRSHGVAAADFDGDGDDDVVFANVAGTAPGNVPISAVNRLCLNTGPGTFTCSDLSADLENSQGVAVADLDGDGDVDIVFANQGLTTDTGATNRVCRNSGAATFTCVAVSADVDESFDVSTADLDGDGDQDLVFANDGVGLAGARNRVCLNSGTATFTCADVSASLNKGDAVAAADLDGDGDVDLAFGTFLGRDRLCLNGGSATFTCSDVSTRSDDAYDVAAADLDRDGDVDLVFANAIVNSQTSTNTLCRNTGSAVFTCTSLAASTDNSRGIVVVDLDADGDPDLLVANERFFTTGAGTGQEERCLNDGTGVFACTYVANDDDSYAVAVGNFRGAPVAADEPVAGRTSLALAPNPTRSDATLTLSLDAAQTVSVAVFDVLGREVARVHDGPLAAGTHTLRIDASQMPPGVYTVRASSSGRVLAQRFTVVR